MDTSSLGKWAWLIGLVVLVLWGLLSAFGISMGDMDATIATIAVILALLGGIFYLSTMKDRTGFFIAVLALLGVTAYAGAAGWDLFGVGQYVWAVLAGAAAAAAAGAVGVLLVVVYEWIMSATR